MNSNLKSHRPNSKSQTSVIGLPCETMRRAGNMRAITLGKQMANTDRIFGTGKTAQESFDAVFGKTPHDVQPEGAMQ